MAVVKLNGKLTVTSKNTNAPILSNPSLKQIDSAITANGAMVDFVNWQFVAQKLITSPSSVEYLEFKGFLNNTLEGASRGV